MTARIKNGLGPSSSNIIIDRDMRDRIALLESTLRPSTGRNYLKQRLEEAKQLTEQQKLQLGSASSILGVHVDMSERVQVFKSEDLSLDQLHLDDDDDEDVFSEAVSDAYEDSVNTNADEGDTHEAHEGDEDN